MSATTTETCRWLIDTTFELQTPLHLGTGQSEAEPSGNADNEETWVAGILLDHEGKATIPGASLKGALRALAEREGPLSDELKADLKAILGAVNDNSTTAGKAEFRYATAIDEVKEIRRPHVAIDRVTGTAMDKKLFQTRLIPVGTRFSQRILLHRASQAEVAALVALLQGAGQDATFTLGAHASQGLGALRLFGQPQIKVFGPAEAKNWLEQGGSDSWEEQAANIDNLPASEARPTTEQGPPPSLPLQLVFSSPFLVKGGVKERDGHDVTVPMRQGEKVILPASSLRGRLRSQAERILRTLGLKVAQGHDARPWRKGKAHTDLAALLFGSAGWRALIGASDCLDTAEKSRLKTQELLAIDRFTGGGKDGAKFSIEAAECPTLAGQLHLDVHRLKQAGDACWPALGLFTLVLRDLAEGDIAFGHGIAKGYGQCQEKQVLAAWESLLQAQFPEQADPVAQALAELRKQIKQDAVVCEEPFTDVKNVELKPLNIPPANNGVTNSFLNPYHFIPFGKPDTDQWTTPEKLQSERGHDRYQGLSGHISCQLTTKTPLFIGASRKKGDTEAPANLDGYEFQNKRAIPATSLRGMISSLFESISGSGLRVLHPQPYSMRKTKNHLSAMGQIIVQGEENKMYLKPLTLPTLALEQRGNAYLIPEKWRKIPIFAGENVPLRVYFDARPDEYQASEAYYMRLDPVMADDGRLPASNLLRHPRGGSNTKFLIGQNNAQQKPINKKVWENKPAEEKKKYTRGWVRTLETPKRRKGDLLPNTVKHLVFLPDLPENKLAFVLNDCAERFAELADMAVDLMHIKKDEIVTDAELLPFVPCGRKIENDRNKITSPPYATRLQHGDLVFFDIDDNGKISEISFSSMWRTGIKKRNSNELATTADLLAQYDPNLLPLGMGGRKPLFSSADLLFGAVEYRAPGNKKVNPSDVEKKQALALAGRVSIGIAQADTATVTTEPAITLKELSSPKPPSPAMYFKPLKNDGYVSKAKLAENSSEYTLRGRKTYLHAWREQGQVVKLSNQGLRNDQQGREPWASTYHGKPDPGHKRRVKVEPISAGQSFSFHIDFHNLSEDELQQLCATLQPDPAFEHRLGMGKPLGLGSVKLQIRAIQLINRTNRYASDALTADRSHQTLSTEEIVSLAAAGMQAAHRDVRRALQLLGNPAAIAAPVHYPQVEGASLKRSISNGS
jgi:CRISPR-associated protein (TIGR03986 family)